MPKIVMEINVCPGQGKSQGKSETFFFRYLVGTLTLFTGLFCLQFVVRVSKAECFFVFSCQRAIK